MFLACTPPPPPAVIADSPGLWRECERVQTLASRALQAEPARTDGEFTDVLLNKPQTGCRFSATIPAREMASRFSELRTLMLGDEWFEEDLVASDTTFGMMKTEAFCYFSYQGEPSVVEGECYSPATGAVWRRP